jgi:hypothetical protein
MDVKFGRSDNRRTYTEDVLEQGAEEKILASEE